MQRSNIVFVVGLVVASSVPVSALLGWIVTRLSPTDAPERSPIWAAIMGLIALAFIALTVLPVPQESRWFTGSVALVGLASAIRAGARSPVVRRVALDVALVAGASTFVLVLALMS